MVALLLVVEREQGDGPFEALAQTLSHRGHVLGPTVPPVDEDHRHGFGRDEALGRGAVGGHGHAAARHAEVDAIAELLAGSGRRSGGHRLGGGCGSNHRQGEAERLQAGQEGQQPAHVALAHRTPSVSATSFQRPPA